MSDETTPNTPNKKVTRNLPKTFMPSLQNFGSAAKRRSVSTSRFVDWLTGDNLAKSGCKLVFGWIWYQLVS
jgi:hypothetical protein